MNARLLVAIALAIAMGIAIRSIGGALTVNSERLADQTRYDAKIAAPIIHSKMDQLRASIPITIDNKTSTLEGILGMDVRTPTGNPREHINLTKEPLHWTITVSSDVQSKGTPTTQIPGESTAILAHNPPITAPLSTSRRFDNFTNNLARGANLMTSISGCHIAAWVYYQSTKRKSPDCGGKRTSKQQLWNHRREGRPTPRDLMPYDTVFVHKRMLFAFVNQTLPHVQVPIILLSGSYENSKKFILPLETRQTILDSPLIAHWFCQNVMEVIGLKHLPDKVHPLALGIEPFGKDPKAHVNPAALIRDVILRYSQTGLPQKTIEVFEAYASPNTNPKRLYMPRGIKLPLPEYLETIARSKFVLSPDGHKPDCFRHYESLGLGAIPITELDPVAYSHLRAGPVVFGNQQWWNLTESRVLKLWNRTNVPKPNQNLIFEEYWMEQIESVVGLPIRWFDIRSKHQAHLEEFSLYTEEVPWLIEMAWENYSPNSTIMLQNYRGEKSARKNANKLVWKRSAMQQEPQIANSTDVTRLEMLNNTLGSIANSSWGDLLEYNRTPVFLQSMFMNLARGANLQTSISGCHYASWIYMEGNKKKNPDCGDRRSSKKQRFNLRDDRLPRFQPFDTVFVHVRMVKDFSTHILPRLQVPIVLLTGSYDNTRNNMITRENTRQVLQSPLIIHWFCQNLFNSTGLEQPPPKLSPLALGVEPFGKNPGSHANPVVIIRDALLRYAFELPNKTQAVFEAYTSPYTNANRANMPRGTKMLLPDYLEELARSKFVHKPDCFRHYEALAFGAIPITDLNPVHHKHLQAGPVIFQNQKWWNLTESKALTMLGTESIPEVNRNLIFEEYWMESMERTVGRHLRWFDVRTGTHALLSEFHTNATWVPLMIESAHSDHSHNSSFLMKKFAGEFKAWQAKKVPFPIYNP